MKKYDESLSSIADTLTRKWYRDQYNKLGEYPTNKQFYQRFEYEYKKLVKALDK